MTSKGSKKGTTGTEPNTTNGDMTRVDGVVLPEYRLPALKRDLTRLVDENASFDVMQPVFANLLRCYEEATGVDLGLSRETIDAYATHVVNIATTQPENNRAPLVVYEGLERLTEETVIPKIMEGWTNSSGTMPFDEYLELMKGPAEFIDAAARQLNAKAEQLNVEYVAKIDTLETELTGARTELDVAQATYEESLAAMEASDDSELQIADPEEMQILKGQLEQVTSDYDHAKTRVAELATKLGVVKGEYTEYQNVAQTRISGLIDEVGKLAQKEAYANQLEQKLGEAEAKNVALETSSDEKSTGFRDVLAETRNNYLTEAKKVAELGKALAETSARLKEAESNYQTEINNAQLLETKFDDVDARVTELEILLQETENEYQANWQIIEGNLQTALGNLEIAQQNHEDLDLEFSVHRDETDILLTESGVMALRDQYRQLEVDFERLDRGYDTLEEKSGKEIVAKQNEIDSNEAEISSLKASRSNWKFGTAAVFGLSAFMLVGGLVYNKTNTPTTRVIQTGYSQEDVDNAVSEATAQITADYGAKLTEVNKELGHANQLNRGLKNDYATLEQDYQATSASLFEGPLDFYNGTPGARRDVVGTYNTFFSNGFKVAVEGSDCQTAYENFAKLMYRDDKKIETMIKALNESVNCGNDGRSPMTMLSHTIGGK